MKKNRSLTVTELPCSAELHDSSDTVMSWHTVCNEIRRLDDRGKDGEFVFFFLSGKTKCWRPLGRFRHRFEGSFVLEC